MEGKDTDEQGAGDQGLMFGFAVRETPELMPAPIAYSHQLGRELTRLRKNKDIAWLRPDAKTQVSVEYEDEKPIRIDAVVISTMHADGVKHYDIKDTLIELVVKKVLPAELLDAKTRYLINPTGRFVIGGPEGDSGLTGRKIIVDTYGGMGRHGGGAFSGKDPSKVDRSAAYMGRYVAKNVVAAGLADRCEVQFAYAIGFPDPVSVMVETSAPRTSAARTARLIGRLDHQLGQTRQDVLPFRCRAAQEGRHVGNEDLFAQVVLHHLGHVGVHNLVVGHARARGVDQRHPSGPVHVHQPRHAQGRIRPEGLRIQKIIVYPPVDHVDPLESFGRAHPDEAVRHDEVPPLDELHAHLLGQEGMLEIRRVVNPRRQDGHARRLDACRGHRLQHVAQPAGIVVNRTNPGRLEDLRKRALHHDAVLQDVGHA